MGGLGDREMVNRGGKGTILPEDTKLFVIVRFEVQRNILILVKIGLGYDYGSALSV